MTGPVPKGSLDVPEPSAPESAASVAKAQRASPKRARLIVGRPRRAGATRHIRALRVTIRASADGMRNARLVLRDRSGHRMGASNQLNLGTYPRAVVIHLVRPWHPGRYTLRATAQTADGHTIAATRRMTIV